MQNYLTDVCTHRKSQKIFSAQLRIWSIALPYVCLVNSFLSFSLLLNFVGFILSHVSLSWGTVFYSGDQQIHAIRRSTFSFWKTFLSAEMFWDFNYALQPRLNDSFKVLSLPKFFIFQSSTLTEVVWIDRLQQVLKRMTIQNLKISWPLQTYWFLSLDSSLLLISHCPCLISPTPLPRVSTATPSASSSDLLSCRRLKTIEDHYLVVCSFPTSTLEGCSRHLENTSVWQLCKVLDATFLTSLSCRLSQGWVTLANRNILQLSLV